MKTALLAALIASFSAATAFAWPQNPPWEPKECQKKGPRPYNPYASDVTGPANPSPDQALKQFIIVMKPGRPELQNDFVAHLTDGEKQALAQHVEYLNDLFAQGKLIFAGTSDQLGAQHFGIAIVNAEDKARAEASAASDPAVRIGILRVTVLEFNVFLSRPFQSE